MAVQSGGLQMGGFCLVVAEVEKAVSTDSAQPIYFLQILCQICLVFRQMLTSALKFSVIIENIMNIS